MLVYYKDIENLNNPITFGEAAFLIANGCADYLGLRYRLLCSFRETFFDLAFYPDDHLVFGLVPALSIWEKEFTNYCFGVDIASYIEIMLMICKDFKINKMELGSF